MTPAGANPFSVRSALLLVVLGAAVFVALLWMIGAGMMTGPVNDGGNHAGGRGLNGFAAFSQFLDKRGYEVRQSRSEDGLKQRSLLVLTPPHGADAEELSEAIRQRRRRGPTIVILPKWVAMPVPDSAIEAGVEKGWVMLGGARPVLWADDVDALGALDLRTDKGSAFSARWSGFGQSGTLPDAKAIQTMSSGRYISLVEDGNGQVLASYLDDGRDHPGLARFAFDARPARIKGSDVHPVVVVTEPDLLNNYGFARRESALLADALVSAATNGRPMPVVFDLTFNGHGRSANLLTLAFTPPFLAATLCLLMAALAVGWRAFLRFGPPRKAGRKIAFGKAALVSNSAGLLRRARRLHLVTGPYLERTRERLARALALPRTADAAGTDDLIDRALKSRAPDAEPFSSVAAALRTARSRHDAVHAARKLHALERTLTR